MCYLFIVKINDFINAVICGMWYKVVVFVVPSKWTVRVIGKQETTASCSYFLSVSRCCCGVAEEELRRTTKKLPDIYKSATCETKCILTSEVYELVLECQPLSSKTNFRLPVNAVQDTYSRWLWELPYSVSSWSRVCEWGGARGNGGPAERNSVLVVAIEAAAAAVESVSLFYYNYDACIMGVGESASDYTALWDNCQNLTYGDRQTHTQTDEHKGKLLCSGSKVPTFPPPPPFSLNDLKSGGVSGRYSLGIPCLMFV